MSDAERLDSCGCCDTPEGAASHDNAPGLPEIRYRLGRHGDFLRRMLERLSGYTLPDGDHAGARPLAALTTRSTEDPAVALLDAWATAADVLAFYQERIANEGYLRTAAERRSVLELARAIGYELNPGVAAGTHLAFTVDDAPGAPGTALLPVGTQVKSVPGPGELPQTFETAEALAARASWNALRPRLERTPDLALYRASTSVPYSLVLLEGDAPFGEDAYGVITAAAGQFYTLRAETALPAAGTLRAVSVQSLYLDGTDANLKRGDTLLLVGHNRAGTVATAPFRVRHVVPDDAAGRTRIDFSEIRTPIPFGWAERTPATVTTAPVPFDAAAVEAYVKQKRWRAEDFAVFLDVQGWDEAVLLEALETAPEDATAADRGVFALRERLGFFGSNAPPYSSLPRDRNDVIFYPGPSWDSGWEIWKAPENSAPYFTDADAYLERVVEGVVPESWAVFRAAGGTERVYRITGTSEKALAHFALSGKSTGLVLADEQGRALNDDTTDKPAAFGIRTATAYLKSEPLGLAPFPLEGDVEEVAPPEADGEIVQRVGVAKVVLGGLALGLTKGQPVVVEGEQVDAPGVVRREVALLDRVEHDGGYTVLYFEDQLAYRYTRVTVRINANVVPATHGETVEEVLGSGNGAVPNQRFVLKKPPLTHVSAPTASGGASTLAVRVNGVRWDEAPSLYGLGPGDRRYVLQQADDGTTAVVFGDGRQGARLPTGRENVTATYRSGLGLAGELDAGRLTLLQTRPLGLRDVVNPVPATGGEDPETLGPARTNAPLTVLTLDRVVSLLDYEDFARTFAGIGKALVTPWWDGEDRIAHLTVATAGGDPVEPTSELYENLLAAVEGFMDPVQRVRIDTFQPVFFNLEASVVVEPAYERADVLAAVEAALQEGFAFEARGFGQDVTSAEVLRVMHGVAGVVAVDLDLLYRAEDPSPATPPPAVLEAAGPRRDPTDAFQPAELLLVNPVGITLTVQP